MCMIEQTHIKMRIIGILVVIVLVFITTTPGQRLEGQANVCSYVESYVQKYHTSCGTFGWDRCTRYRTRYQTIFECCPDWSPRLHNSIDCTVAACINGWGLCPNGGTCVTPYFCSCPRGYYSPDCQPCTGIANCNIHECSTYFDQRCVTCMYEHTPQIRAYRPIDANGYADRECEQLCSWRLDSLQCYPGICSDGTPGTCSCAPAFSGTNCMTIDNTPDITYCYGYIYDSLDENSELNCEAQSGSTRYTNIRAVKIKVDWRTQYAAPDGTGPSASPYPYPVYISEFNVGVVAAQVDWTITRTPLGGTFPFAIKNGAVRCDNGISSNSPDKGLRTCNDEGAISTTLQSGDTLYFSPKTTNGGNLIVKNYDNSGTSFTAETKYYSGLTLSHTARYVFDFDPPYHCLYLCASNPLDVSVSYTRESTFTISWEGWSDDISGVKSYQYEVYKFKAFGTGDTAVLDYKTEAAVATDIYTTLPSPLPSVSLTEPGMYCVLLIVYDDTSDNVLHSNHRLARHFLLYDDSSQVETSNHTDQQMFVSSAAQNTSYEWITTLDEPVTLQWTNHFFNEFHRTNFLLNSIDPHSTNIDAEYEVRTGQPPNVRSMEAIPNVNGILSYKMMYGKDHQGGRSLTSPDFTWEYVANFQNEEDTKTISREDGDSIRFWVEGFDVMGNSVIDDLLVHVDSSYPIIENVGLTRDGEVLLAVHSNIDLFDMVLKFDTYDYHSGMKQITWELKDMKDGTLHGDGAVAVVRTNNQDPACVAPNCYCIQRDEECFLREYLIEPEQAKLDIPYADHDYDYLFIIKTVNNAMLQTTYTFQITVDVSPPQPGHVLDAEPGNKDIDYQSSLLVHASWNGFFDRESGIKYYKYALHTACLTESDFEFGASPPAEITTTHNTYMSESVSQTGTYYTTVVAYNNALGPSHPVCSDGVTIDTTGPSVASVHVNHAFVKPGLVTDGQTIMYMDEEGFVYQLATQTEDCSAVTVSDLSLYESRTFPDPLLPNQDNCSSYNPAGSTFYMASENLFELTWVGTDAESTIHDYMIALSSTSAGNGDIMPFTSSHGNVYFITYHPNLVDRQEFYISIKAINKAGLEGTKIFGPLQIRIIGPAFNGDITLSYHREGTDLLLVSLGETPFDTSDVNKEYLASVEYSLSEGSCNGEQQFWTDVDNPTNSLGCDNSWPPTCVLIDPETQGFHLHDSTDYCFSLHLSGYNKLVTSVSAWYSHSKLSVSSGMLWEIDTSTDDLVEKDIDFQVSTEAIHLRYLSKTSTPGASLTYSVGVGTTAGMDDVKAFGSVDMSDVINVEGLNLQFNMKYYTSLKVIDADINDTFVVTSDGLVVLPVNTEIPSLTVYDGVMCSEGELMYNETLSHHMEILDLPSCGVDIDYQTYTTVLSVYWSYNASDAHIQYFKATVEKQTETDDVLTWEPVLTDYVIGDVNEVTLAGLYLEAGHTYRVNLQPCHPAGCYMPTASNGVTILSTEPVLKDILDVVYNELENSTSLSVTWEAFLDPYHGIDFDIINQYALAVFVRPVETMYMEQLTEWTHLQIDDYDTDPITKQINTTYTLEAKLEASSCLMLAVRGYNKAMLYSTAYKEFKGCSVPDRYQLLVLDAVGETLIDGTTGDISLNPNDAWTEPEAEYTRSKTSLAAVWPNLKHGYMRWSVVHGDNVNRLAYKKNNLDHLDYWDFDCAMQEVLACGSTFDRFVNVHNLALEEGNRYHICIYANDTVIVHEKWNETLPEVSVCSNGVTVDTESPIGGKVWTGNKETHGHFQTDNLVLVAHWNSFLDVEVNEKSSHHSGIKTYYLAVGTYFGGQDVLDFQDVGITNMKIITGLSLKNGEMYFVTVKAWDFVGLETSATSESVTIDMTHPVVNRDKLLVSECFLSAENSIQIVYINGAFVDPESGIASYMWCIGSKPGLCDVLARTHLTSPVLMVTSSVADFVDGQEYHVLMEAYNGASLSVSTTAATFVVDVSGPLPGYVHEVASGSSQDIDYQVSHKELHLIWGDFVDPESHILEYRLSIGSCKGCFDVLNDVYVGLVEEYQITNLQLKQGVEYFTQVRACNSAHLCTVVTSDGLVIDASPPYLGPVFDGLFDADVDYQAKNDLIEAHLENVHDIQSGLSIISWWAGTSAGDSDVFTEEKTHSHTIQQRSLNTALSEGTTVYTTVKVCNKAGLCTIRTSDGVTIDSTPPTITGDIERIPTLGMLVSSYQIYRNTLALQWLASESGSPIVTTYVSLLPQDDAHLVLPTVKLTGNPESYIFAGLDLRDGDCYRAKVTVCNAANLCSEKESSELKVDSSPPTSGAFAVDTEFAEELNRQRDGHMTYDNSLSQIKLAWVGFQDPHSDILDYQVRIGTFLHTSDLAEQQTLHQTTDPHADEGFVVTETVTLFRPLLDNEQVYISITATNTAGLQSTVLHGLFIAIPSGVNTGILELERRCSILSCVGHCMCAPHGFHGCDNTEGSCTDRTGESGYATVTVHDVIPTTQSNSPIDVDVIPSLHILQAEWTVASDVNNPLWYDWSVGVKDETPGSGLLDINAQPVWYEAGTSSTAVFSMANSKLTDAMSTHVTYVVYVKAWYDSNSYIIFQSDGVQVDSTAPELSDSYSVIEVTDAQSNADIDFTASATDIVIKWTNVFIDSHSDMDSFEVMIYSNKLLDVIASDQVAGGVDEVSFTGLSLIQGQHYVSKVVGCNRAGLCTEATSDGFVLDTTPPIPGSVLDGNGFHDLEFSTTGVTASWHGFYDDESFIDHYTWCYSVGGTEVGCQDVGLYQQKTISLPDATATGEVISSAVSAVNAAGLSSIPAESDGFILDKTLPVNSHYFNFDDNIVLNGDFTSGTDNWEVAADLTKQDIDNALCILNGIFKQTLSTLANHKYRLKFDAFSGTDSSNSAILGYVQFGLKEHHVISAADMNDYIHTRQKVYFLTAHSTSLILEFGTMTDGLLCIGNIILEQISEGSRENKPAQHPEANFTGSIHVHVIASEVGTTVVLNWDFADTEAPVIDYMVAIGTVQGGIQLKDYTSTGTSSSVSISGLMVQHGTTLYSTVVATNAAGLSLVVHSDPVIVDLTPPVIEVFLVNAGDPVLSRTDLTVEWLASDPESGVENCDFSAENPNDATFEFTTQQWSSSGLEITSLANINNGDTISCKLICKSYRDLYNTKTVGPLTYVTEPANMENANVHVIPYSETYYSVRENYLPTADKLWFRWDGIVDPVGIENCQALVSDGTGNIIPLVSLGSNQHATAVFTNTTSVFQENTAYTVQVSCVNKGGYDSDPIVKEFHIDSTLPVSTGEPLGIFWTSDSKVQMNWSGLFTSSTTLIYELHMGTNPGGLDVLSWLETTDTEIEITDINSSFTHYLSISAISQNGLYVTSTFTVKY